MSHQPPPKSPYGDTELTDDGWTRTSTTSQADYPTVGSGSAQPPRSSLYGQPGQRLLHEQPQPVDFANIASSMTQDDIIFMRKVRTDCFLYRVLPLNLASYGALYMYNKSKNLPHKFGRYAMVGLASSFFAVATFRGRFRQLVSESRSNTLYMQTLRKSVNLPPVVDDFAGDYGMEYGSKLAYGGSSNWDATDLSGDSRFGERTSANKFQGQAGFEPDSYQPLEQPQDNFGMDAPKQTTTYDELRARNRGYIK